MFSSASTTLTAVHLLLLQDFIIQRLYDSLATHAKAWRKNILQPELEHLKNLLLEASLGRFCLPDIVPTTDKVRLVFELRAFCIPIIKNASFQRRVTPDLVFILERRMMCQTHKRPHLTAPRPAETGCTAVRCRPTEPLIRGSGCSSATACITASATVMSSLTRHLASKTSLATVDQVRPEQASDGKAGGCQCPTASQAHGSSRLCCMYMAPKLTRKNLFSFLSNHIDVLSVIHCSPHAMQHNTERQRPGTALSQSLKCARLWKTTSLPTGW